MLFRRENEIDFAKDFSVKNVTAVFQIQSQHQFTNFDLLPSLLVLLSRLWHLAYLSFK